MATAKKTTKPTEEEIKAKASEQPEEKAPEAIELPDAIKLYQQVENPALMTLAEDHSFTLEEAHYKVALQLDITGTRSRTRIIDITEPTDPINIEISMSYQLVGDIHAKKGRRYLIQYLNGREWNPIQTLKPSDYTLTLTRQ
jgi:hypothetical protein